MNATRWQAITNPVKMWRKWHKLKGQVKALEERVAALEEEDKELVEALYGLGDILRDMNTLDRIIDQRVAELERIIQERTADS